MTASPGGWDVHTHLIPPAVIETARSGRYGTTLQDDHVVLRGHPVPRKRIVDPAALIAWIRNNGLQGAFVSPPPPTYRPDLDSAGRRWWTAMLNDSLATMCAVADGDLRPMAYLPIEDHTVAAAVANDLDTNFAGVVVGTELAGGSLADPRLDAVWEVLQDRRLPVFVHPGTCPDPRIDDFYLSNLAGNPIETSIAVAQLVFGGVLDRFANLKFILAHGGGAVASMVGRWDRGHSMRRPGVPDLPRSPSTVVRRMFVDSVVHDLATLQFIMSVFGEDHVLFGSDWPFPMGADSVQSALAGLPDQQAEAIVRTNASRLPTA